MKPEQLDKLTKLEGWRNELKLLEDEKAGSSASWTGICVSNEENKKTIVVLLIFYIYFFPPFHVRFLDVDKNAACILENRGSAIQILLY